MNLRRGMALVGFALVLVGSAQGPLAASDKWTPDRVRAFVIRAEGEMQQLMIEELKAYKKVHGKCHGMKVYAGINKAIVMPRIQAVMAGKALSCYVASYLGCSQGDWIIRGSQCTMVRMPFTRSKVTIIEQTADRVVADVAEATYDDLDRFVAGITPDGDYESRPFTDAEVDAVKTSSRYTITRGSDGAWRISDRKPSFKWLCDDSGVAPGCDDSAR